MTATLVIGIGNTLAADDGIGPLVAERLRALTDVRVIVARQITPELAEEIATVGRVVFIDASLTGTCVEVVRVAPATQWPALAHALTPAELLALTRAVYGRYPEARMVTIPGHNFEAGASPSTDARRHLRAATRAVEALAAAP